MRMFYLAPGPIRWVTPLSAFPTPVPPTASYYTIPQYYVPPAAPVEPATYGMPIVYGAPYAYEPSCYIPQYYFPPAAPVEPATYGMPIVYGAPYAYEASCYKQVAAPSPPRGEYRFGRCLLICQ